MEADSRPLTLPPHVQVHESASPEALKQTMEVIAAADAYNVKKNVAKMLPLRCLQRRSRSSLPVLVRRSSCSQRTDGSGAVAQC